MSPGTPIRLRGFQQVHAARSRWQIANSFGGYLLCLALMYLGFPAIGWPVLLLAPVAAGFVIRIFIIQHDCGHGSFFIRPWANDLVGWLCSLVTFAPYLSWRRQHAGHHAVWNDLARRDNGVDIYSTCLTVAEYRALSPGARWRYRAARHPLVANLLLPPLVFLLLYRTPFDAPRAWVAERRAVHLTNLALLVLFTALALAFGVVTVAAIHLSIMVCASIAGVWLFTVQHRGPTVQWLGPGDWTATRAALCGTTHLRLPRLLQWFTGNIGFHHIHHLNPRIPNYRLPDAHAALPPDVAVPTLTLGDGLRVLRLNLWDEQHHRLVAAADLRDIRQLPGTGPSRPV